MSQSIKSRPTITIDHEPEQVLLVDDLAMAAKWLQTRASRLSTLSAWISRHPRVTLLASVLAASVAIMFGYAAFYFSV
jgi:negative regulator of sigma E activity